MRIENQLPPDLLTHYGTTRVHKATKKGKSTIVVQTRDKQQDVWRKHGKRWVLDSPRQPQHVQGEGWFTKQLGAARGDRAD